jgi:hypothetical protein
MRLYTLGIVSDKDYHSLVTYFITQAETCKIDGIKCKDADLLGESSDKPSEI